MPDEYYNSISEGYDQLHEEEQLRKLEAIKKEFSVSKETKLLDVGCGSGISSQFDCVVTGIDPSEELLKQCLFKTIKAKAESIPFPDKSFDVVIAVTSIHNFNDIEAGLKEIKRVGKDLFALTVLKKSPKKDSIIYLIKKHFKIKKEIEEEKDIILICNNI